LSFLNDNSAMLIYVTGHNIQKHCLKMACVLLLINKTNYTISIYKLARSNTFSVRGNKDLLN